MESTYGNRTHPKEDPMPELAELITATARRGGSVVVPAFAIERTQKFVFIFKHLIESGQILVCLFSATALWRSRRLTFFLKHDEEYSDETRDMIRKYGSPLQWPGFTFASTAEESKKINAAVMPSVIISSSGMVTGGRILHHLAQRLPDPRNLVLFIGFQAPGTRGFAIKTSLTEVKIFGDFVPIRAQIAALEQFSDHADPPELLQWLRTFKQPAGHNLSGARGARRFKPVAGVNEARPGMERSVAQYLEKVRKCGSTDSASESAIAEVKRAELIKLRAFSCAPESIDCAPAESLPPGDRPVPAATSAAAALRNHHIAARRFLTAKNCTNDRRIFRASPPAISCSVARAMPNSSGSTS
jgi:predicted metal-dependent RNase